MSQTTTTPVEGTLTVFGHEDTRAELEVIPRSTGWRLARAGGFILGGLVAAPVVALLPPHAAWALGAAGTGVFFGLRKWSERYTLVSLEGPCPRCGAPIRITSPTRLRSSWNISCDACHHAATLDVPDAALPAAN
ncbi:MAG: hypothetical protein P8188_01095 [Gemmatimonadota bacterium]|jgi:hypothetical protein